MNMGGMRGSDLGREAKLLVPGIPVVVISGWAVQHGPELRDAGVEFVLIKPCLIEDLLKTVQKALSQPVPA